MHTGILFAEAMHVDMLRRMRLIRSEDRVEAWKRMGIVVAVGWLPMAILAAVQGGLHGGMHDHGDHFGFFTDIAVHARFLLAAPLFIASEYIVLPRLESIGRHFRESSLIPPSQMETFDVLAADTKRLSAGVWPSLFLLAFVYILVFALAAVVPSDVMPAWQRSADRQGLSLPGWWHLLVALPMMLGLIFAWLWRLLIWVRFLWRLSRMGLCLVAAHPDHAAGLQFLAFSPRIFAPVAFAMSVVVAGTLANKVLLLGASPIGHEMTPAITAAVMLLVFASPPLVFSRALLVTWRNGVFLYGELASRMGQTFESQWLTSQMTVDTSSLERPDFSSTTDLYGIVGNVYDMRLMLFDYQGLAALAISGLLPFVPVWLSAIPMSTIVHHLVDALF